MFKPGDRARFVGQADTPEDVLVMLRAGIRLGKEVFIYGLEWDSEYGTCYTIGYDTDGIPFIARESELEPIVNNPTRVEETEVV